MSTREDIAPIFEKALAIVDDRETLYGDLWKKSGKEVTIPEVFRKANYIKAQYEKGRYAGNEKFKEDLLDIMNWAAFSVWHLEQEKKI